MTMQTSNWRGHCRRSWLGLPHACCHKGIFLRLSDDTPPRSQRSWRIVFFPKHDAFHVILLGIRSRNSHGNSQPFLVIGDEKQILSFIAWNSGWQLEEWSNKATNLEILKFKNHKHQTLIVVILRYLRKDEPLHYVSDILYLTTWI